MTNLTRLRFGDVCWEVRQDIAPLLFDSRGLQLSHWLESGQASIVKSGPHRTVYRVQLEGQSLYVKHFRVADARAMLSQWARLSRARREWNRAEQAMACALPTITPLAIGEQRRAGLVFENYLVTEGIEDVEPLDSFVQNALPLHPEPRQGQIRRRLATGLAELVARFHEAGIVHPDLHAGNVLVRMRRSEQPELFLVDLQEARLARSVGWSLSRTNLIAFGLFFLTVARRIDSARFLRRYLQLRFHLGVDFKVEARRLQVDLRRRALRFWRKLDYRCITNNRRFFYQNIGSAHGFAVSELGRPAMQTMLSDPDAPFRCAAAVVLKASPSSNVVRLPLAMDGSRLKVIYKRFNCPKRFDALRGMLHHSPALRAWHAGHGLLIRRIPTPRPLAVMERLVGPLVRENYLITQAIPDSINLRDYLCEVLPSLEPEPRRRLARRLLEQLGTFIRKMHDRNISHRDMKASNFLLAPIGSNAESAQLCLIDLAGVKIWRRLPIGRCVQNLARVSVSLQSHGVFTRTDFLRLLFAYMPSARHSPERWKPMWRDVQTRSRLKIARNRKLARPVA